MFDAPSSPDGFMKPRHLPLALLLLAGCDDPECCAFPPPELTVTVNDETGTGVRGARVRLEHADPVVAPDTATVDGFASFAPPPGPVRVVVAPPDGYAIADSSHADTTVIMSDSTSVSLTFVLKRTL